MADHIPHLSRWLTYKVERVRLPPRDGHASFYFLIRAGTRRQPITFFNADQVPPFEGEEAWFEVDRRRRPWKFIRQVEKPSLER